MFHSKIIKKMNKNVIGFDVSKKTLDYAYENLQGKWVTKKIDYTDKSIKELAVTLPQGSYCIMEATGPYYLKLAKALFIFGLNVCVVNPLVIKHYARMKMLRTKTDKVDSILIACYGKEQNPVLWQPTAKIIGLIRDKESTQRFLIKQLTAFTNKLESLTQTDGIDKESVRYIKQEISNIKSKIDKLDEEIEKLISEHFSHQYKLLRTIPGIGRKTATLLIIITHGFKKFDHYKKLTSYVGLSPRIYESGTSVKGKARICKMGMKRMRQLLYMAALTAQTNNKACSDLYDRLIQKGKPKKLARVAVANKLVRQAYGVINNNLPYCVFS